MDHVSSTVYNIIVSAVTMGIIATIAVFLRLSAKRLTKAGFTIDDYWITFALVSFWVYIGVMLWGMCFHKTDWNKLTSSTTAGMFDGAGGASMTNNRNFKFSGYRIFLKVCLSSNLT